MSADDTLAKALDTMLERGDPDEVLGLLAPGTFGAQRGFSEGDR
jgi:hypothetical protein